MLHCWSQVPAERPTFPECVNKLNGIISPIANYMDMATIAELVGVTMEDVAETRETTEKALKSEAERKRLTKHDSLTADMLQQGVLTDTGILIVLRPSTPELSSSEDKTEE